MIRAPAIIGSGSVACNATTTAYNFGSVAAYDHNTPLTVLAYMRPAGAGESGIGYILSRLGSASTNGLRLAVNHNAGSPNLVFGLGSSGTSGSPQRTSNTGVVSYGPQWQWLAGTADGTLDVAGMNMYHAVGDRPLKEPGYSSSTSGTGTLLSGSGNSLFIGNRTGTDRTFNGDVALVAVWKARLSLDELEHARKYGPLSVRPGKLVLCFANGIDYALRRIPTITAQAPGAPARYVISNGSPSVWPFFSAGGLSAVQKDADLRWSVISAATKDIDLRWNLLTAIQKDSDFRWNVLSALQRDVDLRWNLISAALKDVTLQWDIQSSSTVVRDVDMRWNVLTSLLKDADFRWNVLQAVQKDSALVWNLLAAVSKDADLRWDILSSLTSIFKDVDLRWSLLAQVVRDLSAQWNVLTSVSKDETLIWNIAVAAVRDVDLRWDISAGLGAVTKDATFMWSVINAAQKDITLQWVIQTEAGPEIRSRYIYVLPEEGRVFVLRPENFH